MKKNILLLALPCLWAAGPLAVLAQATPAATGGLLAQLEDNMKKVHTIRARFTQEKHLSLFQDAVTCQGLFVFAAPDHLRWEVTEPFHSLLLMKGRQVEKWEFPKGGKPQRLNLPATEALGEVFRQIANLHQGRFAEEEPNYDIQLDQDPALRMTLTPKNPKMRGVIPRIELAFSPGMDRVTSVVIREKGGDYTQILFKDDQINSDLPDSLFSEP